MNFILIWFKIVREWLDEYLTIQKNKRLTILKEWHGKNCAVLKIDSNITGCKAAYRIIPYDKSIKEDWVIMLYHLPTFRAGVDRQRSGITRSIPAKRHYSYRDHATYRFSVYRVHHSGRSRVWRIYDCDLEGWSFRSSTWAILLPIQTVERALLKYIKKIPHEPHKTSDRHWHEQMKSVDWLGMLRMVSKEVISPNHNLREIIMWESKRKTDEEFWG